MTAEAETPIISVVVPVHDASGTLRRCLESVAASHYRHYECIVVDDGSTDDSGDIARSFPVRIVQLRDGPFGPAYARNRGAEVARGDLVFFVDADVVLQPTTLARVADDFAQHPEIDAVFGSYDDHPEAMDFLSRYRNLLHHFVHQQAHTEAATFWSACGAIRRPVFLQLGGFDDVRYARPSIEDIELGYRLRAGGHKILLDKEMQVQHLKRWTLRGMIKTDVFDRAIPWTHLILRERGLPNDLNLHISHRVSAVLLSMMLVYLGLVAFFHNILILPLLVGLFVLVAGNWSEGTPHFQMSRIARRLTFAFIAAAAGLSLYAGMPRVLPPLGVLLSAILLDQWLPRSRRLWKNVFFGAMVLGLIAGLAFLLNSFSLRIVAPLLLLAVPIVLINYRLYAYLAWKQGLIFMLAVVPFHLMYYLYSAAAFALGIGLYVWKGPRIRGGAFHRVALEDARSRGSGEAVHTAEKPGPWLQPEEAQAKSELSTQVPAGRVGP